MVKNRYFQASSQTIELIFSTLLIRSPQKHCLTTTGTTKCSLWVVRYKDTDCCNARNVAYYATMLFYACLPFLISIIFCMTVFCIHRILRFQRDSLQKVFVSPYIVTPKLIEKAREQELSSQTRITFKLAYLQQLFAGGPKQAYNKSKIADGRLF